LQEDDRVITGDSCDSTEVGFSSLGTNRSQLKEDVHHWDKLYSNSAEGRLSSLETVIGEQRQYFNH
jgi:hypothetical protein